MTVCDVCHLPPADESRPATLGPGESCGCGIGKTLSVYSLDGGEYHYVAFDADDAVALAAAYESTTPEQWRRDYEPFTLDRVADDKVMTIRDGESKDDPVMTMTAAEWVKHNGRGFLCTINI